MSVGRVAGACFFRAAGNSVAVRPLNGCNAAHWRFIGLLQRDAIEDLGTCAAPVADDSENIRRIWRCLPPRSY